ncbi:MAG: hypothetical protein R3C17_11055 [Planctomycetaceae bacterium]
MSTSAPSNQPAPSTGTPSTPAKPKLTFGRIIIGILFVVMLIELVAHFRLTVVNNKLSAELAKAEQEKDYQLTKSTVDQIFGNRQPDESKSVKVAVGEERYDIYYFWGLLKQRTLCLQYGVAGKNSEPEVIMVHPNIPDEVLAAP